MEWQNYERHTGQDYRIIIINVPSEENVTDIIVAVVSINSSGPKVFSC